MHGAKNVLFISIMIMYMCYSGKKYVGKVIIQFVYIYYAVIDCGSPPSPSNANPVSAVTVTTFGVVVTFVCDIGYQATGVATITCEAGASWSGPGPQCNGMPKSIAITKS